MDHIHRVYTLDQVNPAQAHLLPQEKWLFRHIQHEWMQLLAMQCLQVVQRQSRASDR